MQVVGRGGRIQLLKFSLHRNQEPSKQRSAMSTDRNNTDKSKYTYYGQQKKIKPKQNKYTYYGQQTKMKTNAFTW